MTLKDLSELAQFQIKLEIFKEELERNEELYNSFDGFEELQEEYKNNIKYLKKQIEYLGGKVKRYEKH